MIRWGERGRAGRTELHPVEIAPAHGEIQEDAIFYRPKQTAPFVMENTKNLSALTKYLWQAGRRALVASPSLWARIQDDALYL